MFRYSFNKWVKTPNFLYSRRYLKRLREHGVIPDAIPNEPKFILDVTYGEKKVNMGNILTPTIVVDEPKVNWKHDKGALYTLSLVGPDAPSRKWQKFKFWNHWLVGNIAENDLQHADKIAEYIGPIPPKRSGLHRYVFLLFKQPGKIQFKEKRLKRRLDNRSLFSIKKFITKYNLGEPLGVNFFQAQWDKSVPKTRRRLSRLNLIMTELLRR